MKWIIPAASKYDSQQRAHLWHQVNKSNWIYPHVCCWNKTLYFYALSGRARDVFIKIIKIDNYQMNHLYDLIHFNQLCVQSDDQESK